MERRLALKLFDFYKLEKELDRNLYDEDLHLHGVERRSKVKILLESLLNDNSIDVENIRGANTYKITNKGLSNLESYLDIKRELSLLK